MTELLATALPVCVVALAFVAVLLIVWRRR
jgi:hypothetical protein